MRVIALVNQKGGAGKTTVAASIAVAAAQDGETVVVLDADPQGTLTAWGERRGDRDGPSVYAAEPARLARCLAEAERQGATLAVIDSAGTHGPEAALVMAAAMYCLVPVRPTVFDIEATRPVVRLLRTHGRRFGFVLNQVSVASTARNADAAAVLMRSNPEIPPTLAARTEFADAAAAGLGVTEHAPRGKAAAEIRVLWAYVLAQIGGRNG